MSDALVSIRDLHVTLGGNEVLKGLNTELLRGKITAVIGRNGSGKTTLLRAVLKEIPYTGRIEFHCGHKHTRPSPKHVGYVPQKLNVDARLPLTVRDFLALAMQRRPLFLGISTAVNREIEQMLAAVGAGYTIDLPVEKISGGELQRVLLALATHPNPELLLLDEPAAGIDFKSAEPFYTMIARLNQQTRATILLVSHEMNVVSKYAHHVLCLVDGRIACEGPPQETVTEKMLSQTFGSEQLIYLHSHDHAETAVQATPKA
jgi:zinc transport system ATP-binding protein